MGTIYVHTLGDSTFNNDGWLLNSDGSNAKEAKENSVEGQLQSRLTRESSSTYEVVSHAYDGFTTSSVLNGDDVGRVLGIEPGSTNACKKKAYLENRLIDPSSKSYFIHPLNELKKSVLKNPNSIHYVVISVGGNDFREQLSNPIEMLRDIPNIHERYLRILKEVKNLQGKDIRPILMFQYRTDANCDSYHIYTDLKLIGYLTTAVHLFCIAGIAAFALSLITRKVSRSWNIALALISATTLVLSFLSSRVIPFKVTGGILSGQSVGMATLGGLMETFYRPILAQAKEDGIPILDLPNTFNPYEKLYISGIEPSKEGGALIAEGISHIVKHHDFHFCSVIYSKRDPQAEYTDSENPGFRGWQVAYPSRID